MDNTIATPALHRDLFEHPAVLAWRQLAGPRAAPERVETVKLKRKSAVYRLVAPNGRTFVAKRCSAVTGWVEQLIYREILTCLPWPTLQCLGYVPESTGEQGWLFLEDAQGSAYLQDSAEARQLAGRWLAGVQSAELPAALVTRLPDRGPAQYLKRLRTSRTDLTNWAGRFDLSDSERALVMACLAFCDVVEAHWMELESFCEGWPRALVHGDFVTKNLRVRHGGVQSMLLVFDWEMAGWGVPAADVAQFIGRSASPDLMAYHSVYARAHPRVDARDVQRLANYGNVLRVLDKVYWAILCMEGDSYENLTKPISHLRPYVSDWAAAFSVVGWRQA